MNDNVLKRCSLAALLFLTAACSGGGGGAGEPAAAAQTKQENASSSETVLVSLAKPEVQRISDSLTLTGSVTPYEQATLYAKVDGYLKAMHVDIGDHVRRGQLLAEIDVPEMQSELEEKRAEVEREKAALVQARAALKQYQAQVRFEELHYRRLDGIRERDPDVLPQHTVDEALAQYEVAQSKLAKAEADVNAAEASHAAAQAKLETLERLARYSRITAPMAGVVTERFVDPGDLVQSASSSRTDAAPLVSLARVDRVRVLVDVPEPQAPYVRRGTAAELRVSGLEAVRSEVRRTSDVLDPGTRTLRAEVHLPNPERKLRPGMTARVTLNLRTVEDALTVPVSAVRPEGEQYSVFVVEGGVARHRPIRGGMETGDWIQVVEGLSPSDSVVVTAANPLRDGMAVRSQPTEAIAQ